MKLVSYNVNGVRSALDKGLAEWLRAVDPDCFCMQEVKALPEQVNASIFEELGYKYQYWHNAVKKGYSGVTVFTKIEPKNVQYGCGNDLYDTEGRVIRVDFENASSTNG